MGVPSVHLADWPEADGSMIDKELDEEWEQLLQVKQLVDRAMDSARTAKVIGSSLEASVKLHVTSPELMQRLQGLSEELPTIFIASEVQLTDEPAPENAETQEGWELAVTVQRCEHVKCERCWNLRASVGTSDEYPTLCDRCIEVVVDAK